MTANKKFKAIVRERMAATGETYQQALNRIRMICPRCKKDHWEKGMPNAPIVACACGWVAGDMRGRAAV